MNTARELTMTSPSPDVGSGERIRFLTPINDCPTVLSLFLFAKRTKTVDWNRESVDAYIKLSFDNSINL